MKEKTVTHRIAFYTRKVSEKSSIHPSKKSPAHYKYRHERLITYKSLLFAVIEEYQNSRRIL